MFDKSFPKAVRLRTRYQFRQVAQNSRRLIGQSIIIDVGFNQKEGIRLGIVVTKRHGNACVRNHAKRLIREAFRVSKHDLPNGIDLVIRPRVAILKANMQDIQYEIKQLLLDVFQTV